MIEHTTDALPVHPDATVLVDLGDGVPIVERAGELCWGPGCGPDGESRIHGYRVLHTPAAVLH